jgi:23S rRNA (adenine2503-C2)-methyltransferase
VSGAVALASMDVLPAERERIDLLGLPRSELIVLLRSWNVPAGQAAILWRHLYRAAPARGNELPQLSARLRNLLAERTCIQSLSEAGETCSADGLTQKYLLALSDGRKIETVRMHCQGRVTACLSTQAGCAVGCVFCATGQMGFSRNLTAGEIVAQALFVARSLAMKPAATGGPTDDSSSRLRNIVLMGMGEPLLNYDAVLRALAILCDPAGLAISPKRATISTVGVVPGIRRLATEGQPYSLAVSLHAATQAERERLVPLARTWPLDELLAACRDYAAKRQQRIFFEWTLIAGQNDSTAQAHDLARLLADVPAHVNLIPLNPTSQFAGQAADRASLDAFQSTLRTAGIPTTVRRRRGIEIAAGCGQLATERTRSHQGRYAGGVT